MSAALTPERLAEIRDLLKYESSIAFYSHRAKESMLLLVDEAEEAARLRERTAELGTEIDRLRDERADRAAVLREVDEQFAAMKLPDELKGTFNAGSYADAWRRCRAIVQAMASQAEQENDAADGGQLSEGESATEPLIVSRYDVAMEPAPEEEPVFTVGAVAEDGRPVALCFDPETRRKVAGWLAPDAAVAAERDCLALAVQFALQWKERAPVGLREGIEEILATMPTVGEKSSHEADAELKRLRAFAWATARRLGKIRARLATVDIRDSAEAWDLGMAIIAILEGPLDHDDATAPRLGDFEIIHYTLRGYRATDEYRCRKCGAIGCQGTESKTLADLIGMVLRHECLPRVGDSPAIATNTAEEPPS